MKSGKYTLGYKTVLKSLRNSKGIFVFFLFFFQISISLSFFLILKLTVYNNNYIEFNSNDLYHVVVFELSRFISGLKRLWISSLLVAKEDRMIQFVII